MTLIELMITLAVAAILMTLAAPSFQTMMTTNRIAAATNDFVSTLQYARSEAVTRAKVVTVCKSNNVSDSTPSCNVSASWQNGWIVFVDNNNDGVRDSGETFLRLHQALSGNVTIDGATNFAAYIKFDSIGVSKGSTNLSNGSFEVTNSSEKRCIMINIIGRIRTQTGSCS